MTIKIKRYERVPFTVDGLQVTKENLQEIADWCGGSVEEQSDPEQDRHLELYIQVDVHRPFNDRQTMAFPKDWVLKAGSGFKVYTNRAFQNSFKVVKDHAPQVIHRDAGDGRFVSAEEAAADPEGTVSESV